VFCNEFPGCDVVGEFAEYQRVDRSVLSEHPLKELVPVFCWRQDPSAGSGYSDGVV
jgi:hypothetical protein